MRYGSIIACLCVLSVIAARPAGAQSARSLVNKGNGQYKREEYPDAEVNYRKALDKEPGLVEGHFNLGTSLYKQKKYDLSGKEFEDALRKSEQRETQAQSYYNLGNSLAEAQNYQDAVKAYIESLKIAPNDPDTKYNLSYALDKLREQPQKQKQNQQNKNDKNNQKDQQKNDQQKQKQDKQKQDQQQQQQAQQQKKMSKADAERILAVLKDNEREVQKKLHTRQAVRARPDKDW